MATSLAADVLQDELAVSLARALAAANKRARESGLDVAASVITITQRGFNGQLVWRIVYGPKDYVGRRGGDLIIEVDSTSAGIHQVVRGQWSSACPTLRLSPTAKSPNRRVTQSPIPGALRPSAKRLALPDGIRF